ncbi:MAG: outer membrane beta-barrel protein [Chitinophagaceae bacterium]|nr:outer membrane beta-barrel protein [Chitinophagaceae bacterium]
MFRWYISTSFSKQYKFSNNWKLEIRPSINYNIGRNFVIVNGVKSASKTRSGDASISFSFNWNDIFEFSQDYMFNKSHTDYQSTKFRDLNVITHYANAEVVVRIRKNWVWESTINYRHNPQVSPGIATDIFRWNSGVNFLFLKEQKGQLKLFLFDILKQNSNSYRIVNENYVQDVNAIALTRYIMLTFTYNLRDFKGRKVGGSNSLFSF